MMEWLQERFAPGPVFLWVCLALLLLIPLIWVRAARASRRPTVRFSSLRLLEGMRPTWAVRLWFVPPMLRTLSVLCLIAALARGSLHRLLRRHGMRSEEFAGPDAGRPEAGGT